MMPLLAASCFFLACSDGTDNVHYQPPVVTFCCHGGSSDKWKYLCNVIGFNV